MVDVNRENIETFELQSNMLEYLSGMQLVQSQHLYQVSHPGTNGLDFGHFIIKQRYEKNLSNIKPVDSLFVWEEQNTNLLAVG